jgi:endonuclease/exonuclease/phosphatase family metal-dependent hydrolase
MAEQLRLVTYNIRKGKGADGRHTGCVDAIGKALGPLAPDVVLCQEVFHSDIKQSHRLAESLSLTPHYGVNRRRKTGDYGNAILSRFPAEAVQNHDVSTNVVERRGILYARLMLGGALVHVFNVHLGLNQPQRLKQVRRLGRIIDATCKAGEAVLLAGDFNDWTRRIDREVLKMGFANALANLAGKEALTWHVKRPVFNLDRVYYRHLTLQSAGKLSGEPWHVLSDHFPLMATFVAGTPSAPACAGADPRAN